MNLDLVAGLLTGWLALCLFVLHVVSSPRRRSWMSLPEYVRVGFLVTGAMFTWRSVNLVSLAGSSGAFFGRMNAEGMMALFSVTYTVSALAWWVACRTLPDRAWERLKFAELWTRRNPDAVPVMLTAAEVVDIHHAAGTPTLGPGEGVDAVYREASRRARR